MAKKATSAKTKTNGMTINEVAEKFSFSSQYIRRAIRSGKLVAEQVPVKEDSKTTKYLITEKAVTEWRESLNSRSRREDGRNKFVGYLTPEEHEILRSLMLDNKALKKVEPLFVRTSAK